MERLVRDEVSSGGRRKQRETKECRAVRERRRRGRIFGKRKGERQKQKYN